MKPRFSDFTAQEQEIIRRCNTPYRVQEFLNSLPYNNEKEEETLRTFRSVVKKGSAHCLEAALSAAVIMEQHGFAPLLLDLESVDGLDHVLFLYKRRGGWGTVARSRDPGLHGRKPVFSRLVELVDSYADPYVDFSGRITGYGVYDLSNLKACDWRFSMRNVWKVERVLIALPHRRFHMSNQRYRFWYDRFVAYKKRYPNRKPLYYPNRKRWTPGYPRGNA